MALNKKCPVFLKEKQIRLIMSQENCTYKKALYIYLQKLKDTHNNLTRTQSYTQNIYEVVYGSEYNSEYMNQQVNSNAKSYKDALLSNKADKITKSANKENKEKKKYQKETCSNCM